MLYAKVNGYTILKFPVQDIEVRADLFSRNVILPSDLSALDLRSFGYEKVPEVTLPTPQFYQYVKMEQPEWVNDKLVRKFPLQEKPVEEVRVFTTKKINDYYTYVMTQGFEYDFGEAGVHRLDVADVEDRTNWLVLKDQCRDLVEAGYGELKVITVRTLNNDEVIMTPVETLQMLTSMREWSVRMLQHSWTAKNQAKAAGSLQELIDMDVPAIFRAT